METEIQRQVLGFTQGLEFHNGLLFESTGPVAGSTRLNTIDPSGRVVTLANFGSTFFGEGLTILRDTIFQLSWKDHKVFVYDLKGTRQREMANRREGWGLANDGQRLIFTDGGDRLYFADPNSFSVQGSVPIRLRANPVLHVNELEFVDGKIYGNVFMTNALVRIVPDTGCVDAVSDLSGLWTRMSEAERRRLQADSNFVLNGIARDGRNNLFYVTGKNWRTIFVGRFSEAR